MSSELELLHHQAKYHFKNGHIENAMSVFKWILKKYPADAGAHFNLGYCYLLMGDFVNGWPEYEWRLKLPRFVPPESTPIPFWNKEPICGATILVNPEQGYGDTIQFIRYLPLLKNTGCKIILGCYPAHYRLLNGITDVVLKVGECAPPFHCQTALLSLPYLFNTQITTIPRPIPYLSASPETVDKMRFITENYRDSFRIGLVWRGNTIREIHHDHFFYLCGIRDVEFFSLQKDPSPTELKSLAANNIKDLNPFIKDFADTAALIHTMNLVITVDTAVAHLAGAMGKPVWTLLPFVPDWRWLLDREDSSWYPTMRLFRQPALGDWTSVIQRVAEELKSLVGAK